MNGHQHSAATLGVAAASLRVIESFRLENTSKIPKCNPNPPCLLTVPPGATSLRSWNTPRDGESPTSLGSLCHCVTALWEKIFFLISNVSLHV